MSSPPASCSVRTALSTAKVKKFDPPRTTSRQKRCGLTCRTGDHPDSGRFHCLRWVRCERISRVRAGRSLVRRTHLERPFRPAPQRRCAKFCESSFRLEIAPWKRSRSAFQLIGDPFCAASNPRAQTIRICALTGLCKPIGAFTMEEEPTSPIAGGGA